MEKKKIILVTLSSIFLLALAYLGINKFFLVDNNETTINIGLDYPTTSELQEMVDVSDVVVIGEYKNLKNTWNMARDLDNIYKEDKDNYVEGHIYNFKIDKILKGDYISSELIQINLRYSETVEIESSNAIISPEGIIKKEATESVIHEVEVNDPLYIEPELNKKYIVFLSKDDHFNNYFGSIEPFSILIDENGKAELKSNLLDPHHKDLNLSKTHMLNGEKIEISTHVEGEITDEITGKSFEELIELIDLLQET